MFEDGVNVFLDDEMTMSVRELGGQCCWLCANCPPQTGVLEHLVLPGDISLQGCEA